MRIILLLIAISFIAGCNNNKVPEGILPRDKMELVLWDMIQADEFIRNYRLNIDSSLNDTTESIRLYEKVFQLHKISRGEFKTSFDFYSTHPAMMKEVLDSLNVKSTQAPADVNQPQTPIKIDTGALRNLRKPFFDKKKPD